MVRTAEEIKNTIEDNPFKNMKLDKKNTRLYVSFLLDNPSRKSIITLEAFSNKGEIFKVIGKEVYILTQLNIARESLLGKGIIDKHLKLSSTNRNWKTVNKLFELTK